MACLRCDMSQTDGSIYTRPVYVAAAMIALVNTVSQLPAPTLADTAGIITGSVIGALLVAGGGKLAYVKVTG